jgi:uncharacterized membrane protein YdjX (TVP38/TMEM64 family)
MKRLFLQTFLLDMKRFFQISFILFLPTGFILFYYYDLDGYFNRENLEELKGYFSDLGHLAFIYLLVIHILLNIAAIPRVFLTIFSGFVYGPLIGFVYSWIATMAGLIVTFLMVRYLFRQSFERRFGNQKVITHMNNLLEKYGFWTVVFLRVVYVVPSSVLNYSFGFTKIKTIAYIWGSAVGFVPVVGFNVWLGSTMGSEMEITWRSVLLVVFIGIGVLGLIVWLKKKLQFGN